MKKNIIIVLALMVTAGCSSKSAVTPDEGTTISQPSLSSSSSLPQSPSGYGFDQWQTGPLGDVFYDYDSATLSTEAQEQLTQNGGWLASHVSKAALIEVIVMRGGRLNIILHSEIAGRQVQKSIWSGLVSTHLALKRSVSVKSVPLFRVLMKMLGQKTAGLTLL